MQAFVSVLLRKNLPVDHVDTAAAVATGLAGALVDVLFAVGASEPQQARARVPVDAVLARPVVLTR